MQRRTHTLRRAIVVVVALAVGAAVWQSWTAGTPGMSGVVRTTWGPLSPADRDLIVKVRLAGLWEMPTGQQMQQQASSPAVKDVGAKISAEHMVLDQATREVADKLGVLLPASPSNQQVDWMKEISSKTGADYDRTAIQRLRQAHGIVLPVIAQVRVGSRNDAVRAFATQADEYVHRHIRYLEDTGLVDYSSLPETPPPGLLAGSANWRDLLVPGLVVIACLLLAFVLGATLRERNRPSRSAARAAVSTAPRVAAARSPIALPQARTPVHEAMLEEPSTGRFPRIGSATGEFPSAGASVGSGRFPAPQTPARGVMFPRVSDTGPRHAVRR